MDQGRIEVLEGKLIQVLGHFCRWRLTHYILIVHGFLIAILSLGIFAQTALASSRAFDVEGFDYPSWLSGEYSSSNSTSSIARLASTGANY